MATSRPGKTGLINIVIAALASRSWTVRLLSQAGEHPARLEIHRGAEHSNVVLYIWNVTHGGATRSADEFRIQITSGVKSFAPEPGFQTIILGWSDRFGIFVGFDPTRRQSRLGSSPSMQVSGATMRQALKSGAVAQRRKGDDLAVAVRPDRLGDYFAHATAAHKGDVDSIAVRPGQDQSELALADADRADFDLGFGTEAERAQRRAVVDRLSALEDEVRRLKPANPTRGHNNPPELLPGDEQTFIDEVLDASNTIRHEMEKPHPDEKAVSTRTRVLKKFGQKLNDFVTETAEQARKNAAAAIGGAVVAILAAAGGALPGLVSSAIDAIVTWLQLLF